MARRKLENCPKSAPFWLQDRVLGRMGPAVVVTSTQERNVLRRQSFYCSCCVAREEFAAKMPTRCVAGGCSNTPDLENGIALHSIPYFGDDRLQAKKDGKRGWTL